MLRQDNKTVVKKSSTTTFTSKNTPPQQPVNHTILLIQITQAKDTRTFHDYDSPEKAVVGAITLYEDRLRQFNPLQPKIKYTVEDLFEFFDDLGELACLVFDPSLQAYQPKPPEWIKQRALVYLQQKST